MKSLLRILGHKYKNRFSWGEFYWHPFPKQWKLSLKLTDRYSELTDMLVIHPFIFSAYLHLPTKWCAIRSGGDMSDGKSYGFYVYESLKNFHTLVLQWGKKSKHIEMPWTYRWFSTEILDHNYNVVYHEDKDTTGNWLNNMEQREAIRKLTEKTYDYTYVRNNGEVQRRKATVVVERRVWTMRWLPFKKHIQTSIRVTFDKEIGEQVNTWKGGVTGCGYDISKDETPEMTLRRMERERVFK